MDKTKLELGDDVTVKSITLMGNNGELISGNATIKAVYNEAPAVIMEDDATDYITLDCGEKGVKIGTTKEKSTAFFKFSNTELLSFTRALTTAKR